MRLALLLLLFPILFSAQDKTIDSLRLELKNAKHDTTRCNILSALAEFAPDREWEKYNEQLKALAEKNIADNAKPKNFYLKHLAATLNNLGYLANMQGDNPKALACFRKSLKIKEGIGDKKGVGLTLYSYGFFYESQGNSPKALECYSRALMIYEEIADSPEQATAKEVKYEMARVLNNMGYNYHLLGDISRALECHSKSLKIKEELGDKVGVSISFNNIGSVYKDQGDYQKTLEYYYKSLKFSEETGIKPDIALSLNNIGYIYRLQLNIPKALEYYKKSLKIREEIGDKTGVANSLNNIGAIYQNQGSIPMALEYLMKSLKLYEETDRNVGGTTSLNNIGGCYLRLASEEKNKEKQKKNYSLALENCSRSMQLSRRFGYPDNIKSAAQNLTRIYKATGNYKLALENYELFVLMRDSISNEANKKASIKNQLKYEYEKRAAADSVKNTEEQKVKDAQLVAQNASLKSEKTQRYALYGGLVLVAGFLIFVFNRFRVTNKQKKIIEEQKIVVDEAFEKLAEKNKAVIDSITYARRIQRALITSETYIQRKLKEIK